MPTPMVAFISGFFITFAFFVVFVPFPKLDPLRGVQEFQLSDGTPCVRINREAISCNWKAR